MFSLPPPASTMLNCRRSSLRDSFGLPLLNASLLDAMKESVEMIMEEMAKSSKRPSEVLYEAAYDGDCDDDCNFHQHGDDDVSSNLEQRDGDEESTAVLPTLVTPTSSISSSDAKERESHDDIDVVSICTADMMIDQEISICRPQQLRGGEDELSDLSDHSECGNDECEEDNCSLHGFDDANLNEMQSVVQ